MAGHLLPGRRRPTPGPPPGRVNAIAGRTPTGLLVDGIRSPWIGAGDDLPALASLTAIAILCATLAIHRLNRT